MLKRFRSKEEKRRLTAGCFLRAGIPSSYVAIENHVNYVYHAERELTEDEVYGIAAFFNSTLIDRYFRTVSGTTQVNATEIRALNFPSLEVLGAIGKRARENTAQADAIVLQELGVTDPVLDCPLGNGNRQVRRVRAARRVSRERVAIEA